MRSIKIIAVLLGAGMMTALTGCTPPAESRAVQMIAQRSLSDGSEVQLTTHLVSVYGAEPRRMLVLDTTNARDSKVFETECSIESADQVELHTDNRKRRAWVIEKATGNVIFSADFEAGLSWGVEDDQPDWALAG